MVDGVADEVGQGAADPFQHRAVDLGVVTDEFEAGLLAAGGGGIAHQPGEAGQGHADRDQPEASDAVVEVGGDVLEPAHVRVELSAEAAHLLDERQAVVGGRGGMGTDLSGGAERRGGADGAGRGFSRRPQELEGPPAVPAAQGAAEPARALVEGPGLGRPLA